ncbi:uncharacterized protein LOC123535655 [Mercenaria mercenaria]|uniref:uncharacterized protein LOC123535655 n=1 Tax=Mercenaria mercenaria TaxID=6596 RepID=UPI00234E73DF|nr:uncharacterized protein LOC123535655 [Mercenaria mercenaria]
MQVSPVKYCQEGSLAVRCLGLKDESGLAKVALFSDLAEKTYRECKVIELSGVYKKEHQSKKQLAMTHGTKHQFLPDDTVKVDITEGDSEHFKSDKDFCLEDNEILSNFELDAIYEVTGYDCCTKQV